MNWKRQEYLSAQGWKKEFAELLVFHFSAYFFSNWTETIPFLNTGQY